MKKHYSVIIIGAGPAGSAAAHTLAKQGIDVCVIDKAVFPRDKLCAGLLTLRSQKLFQQIFAADWEKAYEYQVNSVKFFYKHQYLNSAENYSQVFLTYRYHFDHYLLNLAKAAGAKLYLGQSVNRIDLATKTCYLNNGDAIAYDYLIGADGVNSIVAKTLFGRAFNPNTIGFALEMEIKRDSVERELTIPEIYMGSANWGYAWLFPKQDYITAGIVGPLAKNPDLKTTFNAFLIEEFGHVPKAKLKGFHIPFGDYRKVLGKQQVLLTGDAAGFADPMSGEGIAYAMQTGDYAAKSIITALNDSTQDVVKLYSTRCAEISRSFAYAKFLSYTLFHSLGQKIYRRLLPRKNDIPLRHLDVLADEIHYSQYMRCVMLAIAKLTLPPYKSPFEKGN